MASSSVHLPLSQTSPDVDVSLGGASRLPGCVEPEIGGACDGHAVKRRRLLFKQRVDIAEVAASPGSLAQRYSGASSMDEDFLKFLSSG